MHHRHHHAVLPVLTCLLATASLGAQELPAPASIAAPASSLVWPTDRIAAEVAADGVIQAHASSWKATFDARGATIHPFVGPDAPGTAATFALRAAHAGEVALTVGDAMPSLAAQRITFERGAVRETFDLRQDGIEQQFVLAELPNRQTLTLDVAVTTALAHRADGDGHAFGGAIGGVRYGAAVVFDADGRRLDVATTWTGEAVRITVPAAFLASAALPLLVDPLIGPIHDGAPYQYALSATDVAWDASLGRFFVCFERAFSATDHDVYVAWLDGAMQPLGVVTIDSSTACWERPRIATLEAHDVVGVVAQHSAAGAAPYAVRMRLMTGGGTPAVGLPFPVATTDDNVGPDIGGDSAATGPSRFLIAWEHRSGAVNDSTPRFLLCDHAGVMTPSTFLGSGIYHERDIAISKTCGKTGGGTEAWALVHRAEPYMQTTGQLLAWFVDRSGQLVDVVGIYQYVTLTGLTENAGSEWDVSSPTDHANGRTFVCVERRVDPANSRGLLVAHTFDRVGNILGGELPVASSNVDRRDPSADCDGARFAIAYASRFSATDSDVLVRTAAPVGNQLVWHDVATVSISGARDDAPAICAKLGTANTHGLAWIHHDSGTWRVQTQLYRAVGAGAITTRATACGGLGIAHAGTFALGEALTLTIDNASGFGGILAGIAANAPIPGCGSCILGADGVALLGSQLTVTVPTNVTLVGASLSFQGVRYDPSIGPCLGSLAFSNTIDAVVQ